MTWKSAGGIGQLFRRLAFSWFWHHACRDLMCSCHFLGAGRILWPYRTHSAPRGRARTRKTAPCIARQLLFGRTVRSSTC